VNLNERAIIEYKVVTKDPVFNTDSVAWTQLRGTWCDIQDVMPSRDERLRMGIELATLRSRIRIRYCSDVDSSMRFVIMRRNETVWNIIGGPAILGNKQWLEFLIEKVSS